MFQNLPQEDLAASSQQKDGACEVHAPQPGRRVASLLLSMPHSSHLRLLSFASQPAKKRANSFVRLVFLAMADIDGAALWYGGSSAEEVLLGQCTVGLCGLPVNAAPPASTASQRAIRFAEAPRIRQQFNDPRKTQLRSP